VICGIPIHPTQQVKTMRLTKTIPLLLLLAAQGLAAQTWPDKPVRFILPVTPGGATDVVARIVTNDLSKSLGQPVVIEHRPGADGIVGAQSVARAAPVGYTLIVALSSFTTAPYQQPTMPYDPAADFAAITEIFAHRATGIRRHELHRCRLRSRRCNDDGVVECAMLIECTYNVFDR
jgi:tripartite-type tricarboxylate transporter receptor subunit TctC